MTSIKKAKLSNFYHSSKVIFMEPLQLPRGSVRAILSLLIVGGFIASCFYEAVGSEAKVAMSSLAGVVITYYFRQREVESVSK